MTYLSDKTLDMFKDLDRAWGLTEIPLPVRVAYMVDCLDLIAPRLPPSVRKEFEIVKKMVPSETSKTALKNVRRRCQDWILQQTKRSGGWEKSEVSAMEALVDILDEFQRMESDPRAGHFHFYLAIILDIDGTLNRPIEILTQKHFSPYFAADEEA